MLISTNDAIVKSIKMLLPLSTYKYHIMNVWCHRFLKKLGYILRDKKLIMGKL